MPRRVPQTHAAARSLFAFSLLLLAVTPLAAAAPKLSSAVSRLSHGGEAQTYDVALPLSGGSGIECRDVSKGTTVVLSFTEQVTAANVAVTAGKATISGSPRFIGNSVLVPLSDVANAQAVTLTASNVSGPTGKAPDTSVTVRFLLGDVNADGVVNQTDSQLIQKLNGKTVDGSIFRADLNVNDTVNTLDGRRAASASVQGGPTKNTAPTVSKIDGQQLTSVRGTVSTIHFTVSDAESSASSLFVRATSADQKLLPDSSIAVSGDGSARVMTLSPPAGAGGNVDVTVNVSDGLTSSSQTFTARLKTPPTNYISIMTPLPGINSPSSGSSVLQLAADELSATVRFNYSNLTTPKTAAHIHWPAPVGQSGDILLDFNTVPLNPDGTYTWTFVPVGTHSVADIVNAIKAQQVYVDVHSSANNANGEMRGSFQAVTGSVTFTPPPSPPSLPGGSLTDADAARFLTQCTYGPTEESIAQVKAMGIDAWLEQQFNMPRTVHLAKLKARLANGEDFGDLGDDSYTQVWWNVALTSPDQLRQRVAFALSQIFVISQVDGDITNHPDNVASYYDMLCNDAFRNYRKLIEDVSLHPAMGNYLDMRGSKKASSSTIPNENWPRELMQLFSFGLYKLQPDGTLLLDANGNPIDTYDQTVITGIVNNGVYSQHGMAAVFTGWNYHQAGTSSSPGANYLDLMTPSAATDHETAGKVIFDGVQIPAGQTAAKDLADALNAVTKHSSTGPFICKQLIQRLVTSNPSPGYVYRVTQVFADNGQGVRGDLRAVIKAILTDYEARSTDVFAWQGYGKLKEPVLRVSATMRALHVDSNSGLFSMRNTDLALSQTPMRAPTVFNFYPPDYAYPGPISDNGNVSPEFQITGEAAVCSVDNFLWNGIRNANAAAPGTFQDGDLKLDISPEQALASNPTALVDRLNRLLMAGQMTQAMKDRIVTYLNTIAIGSGGDLTRARQAIQLVVTSPEFSVQK